MDAVSRRNLSGSAVEPQRRGGGRVERGRGAAPGAGRVQPAVPSVEFDHLDLAELRSYRHALHAEENQVSYWRRILQGRLDVMAAGKSVEGIDVEHLRPALAGTGSASRRRALVQVLPAPELPPLPQLQRLWDRCPEPEDQAGTRTLARDLAGAERQLSDYRQILHRRIEAATAELIARYREDPTRCLSALPQPDRHR